MSLRLERVAEQVRAEIAHVLSRHATDPRLRLVTLTRVDVSPDLSNAIVFFTTLKSQIEEAEPAVEDAQAGLDGAAAFIRRHLAAVLPLRRTPELRFRYDPSLDLGGQTLSVLRTLREGEQHGPEDES